MKKRNKTMKEVICPKWGRCKATKRCPLTKNFSTYPKFDVYVLGDCIGEKKGIVKVKGANKHGY